MDAWMTSQAALLGLWQGHYQGPPVSPSTPRVPSSAGNPIWVIRVKSIWDWAGEDGDTKFAAVALFSPLTVQYTNTHICYGQLSYTAVPSLAFEIHQRETHTRGKWREKWSEEKNVKEANELTASAKSAQGKFVKEESSLWAFSSPTRHATFVRTC